MWPELRRFALGSVVVLAVASSACDDTTRQPADYKAYRSLMLSRALDVEVVEDPDLVRTTTRAAELYARATTREVRTVAPGEAAEAPARILIGLPETRGAAPILARLGATVVDGGFRFACAPELEPADALVGTVEDPRRPGRPVTLVCALDLAGLEPFCRTIGFAWRGGLRAYRAGDLVLEAQLSLDGEVRDVELLDDLHERLAAGPRVDDEGLAIRIAPDTPARELYSWRKASIRTRRAVSGFFGSPEDTGGESQQAQTYAHAEDLHCATRTSDLSHLNPVTGTVHALVASGLPHDGGLGAARSRALELGGRPAEDWLLDGLGVSTVSTWWGRPKALWIASLVDGGLAPPIETLLDPLARMSPHVLVPLRGALFNLLVKEWGKEEVLRLWRGERELVVDEQLQTAFDGMLSDTRRRRFEGLQSRRGERLRASLHRPEFRKGVNLLAPPDAGYLRGFGTRACERSLDDLAAIGANSVALAFRGVVEVGPEGFAMESPAHGAAFLVGDLELVATAAAARARGLSTMLKPEILARPSGIRLGDVAAESSTDAWYFFDQARRFLVHAALVAELCEADLLCIGSELRHVTVTLNPDIPEFMRQNQDVWSDLITALRGSFMGALTYASDWRGEVDGIEFWPQLDFVGMNLYSTLATGADRRRPDDRDARRRLQTAFRKLVEDADARFRPALICEVGFPATTRAWANPDAAMGEHDLEEQARLYRALGDVFADHELTREMFEGLYLWSWSTDPDAGRLDDRGFTPQNRPALEQASRLFAEL